MASRGNKLYQLQAEPYGIINKEIQIMIIVISLFKRLVYRTTAELTNGIGLLRRLHILDPGALL